MDLHEPEIPFRGELALALKDELHGVFIALLIVQQLDAQAQRPVVKTVFRGNGFKEVQGFLHVLVVFVGDGGEVEMHLVRRIGIALEAVEQGLRLGVHPRVQKKRRRRELVAVGGGAVQGVVQGFLPLSGADLAFDHPDPDVRIVRVLLDQAVIDFVRFGELPVRFQQAGQLEPRVDEFRAFLYGEPELLDGPMGLFEAHEGLRVGIADKGRPQALRQGREHLVGVLEVPGFDVEDAELLLHEFGVRALLAVFFQNLEGLLVVALFEPRFGEQEVQAEIAGHALDGLFKQAAGFAGFPVEHEPCRRVDEGLRPVFQRQEEFYGFKDAFLVVAADGLVEQEGRVGTLGLGREVPLHGFLRRTAGAPGEHLHGQHGADHPAQQIADKTRAAAGISPAGVGWRSRKRGRGMSEANAEAHEQTLGVETR